MMQSLSPHLLVLQVVLPLLAAPLCFLLRRHSACWLLAFIVSIAAFAVSVGIQCSLPDGGVLSYALGGWEPPWGIEYRVDRLGAFVLALVSGIAAVTLAFAFKSVERDLDSREIPLFYTAFMLCISGLLGIVITGDAFNLFVFLEISSLSSYVLISLGKDRRALTAAFQYLIIGTIGATMLLIGIGFLYMMTGTLNMADLARLLPEVAETRTVRAAFAFIVVGLSIKFALFPLHIWMPNAYGYAPSAVSVLLAATSTKVAIYALIRVLFTVFGADYAFGAMPLQVILIALCIMAIVTGSLSATFQTNIKHVLAYSSVAQVGYIVAGIAMVSVAGVAAGILHLFNHALMKACLFMALGCVYYRRGSARIEDFRGLGKTMPWTMAAFVIGGLSIIGVPLTAGFISKWYLVLAALDQGVLGFCVIAAVLVGSLIAVAYVWRLVELAYFVAPDEDGVEKGEAPLFLLVPTCVMALANIYFGIHTEFSLGAATLAASELLGGAP